MKKTILAIGITILFIGMSFNSISGIQIQNNPVIISNRGNTLYVGGNGSGNYTKIQDAVDNASDGDTVFVYSGTYYENVIVNKSINLIGEDKNTTVIDGDNNSGYIIEIIKDIVNISGFSIVNGGYGIFVYNKSNIIISENQFYNCAFGNGLFSTDENFVISNTFREFLIAIQMDGSSKHITISKNIITSSTELGQVLGDIYCCGSNHMITNNLLISNTSLGRTGLNLDGVRDSIIQENEFSGYEFESIRILGGSRNNIISYNNIIKNDCGISTWFSRSNKIINNNFINNSKDANPFFLSINNRWDGNYWDEWIGFRYNLPIFQKFPHLIRGGLIGFAIDWHPASEPYDI